jgi:serine/threonine-protein kinase
MSTANLQNLGKYIIIETLGKGAMGVVYKGFDPHIKRTVAIKTIRRELLEADQAASLVARFKNEAQAAGRLSHPGIVGVYEYGEQDTLAYIVMEYIQGNGLDEYFKRGVHFGPTDMISIMAQLLDALDHAHDQGIVHRDIKPSNIIVMLNGRLKLADFGIARIDTSDLTQFGVIMGTPSYIAPEQYLGLTVDRRADIFSAGVIFYQLLSGKKPFSGTTEAIAYKVCHETPPVPSSVEASGGHRHFDAVTLKALARRPEERFQTAQEFREALLKAYRAPATPAVSEQTLIYETTRLTAPGEATSPSRPLGTPAPTGTTGYPPHWDAMILQQVEKHLTRLVGPVARVMVKKAAKTTTDVDSLYRVLADEVANVQDKTQFLATRRLIAGAAAVSAGTHPPTTKSGTQEADVPIVRVTPEAMEQAARRLATYVGPIAKVLAKKAAAQAKDPRQFHILLADNITSDSDRSRFLQDSGFVG